MNLVVNPPTPCLFGKHPPAPGKPENPAGQREARGGGCGGPSQARVPRPRAEGRPVKTPGDLRGGLGMRGRQWVLLWQRGAWPSFAVRAPIASCALLPGWSSLLLRRGGDSGTLLLRRLPEGAAALVYVRVLACIARFASAVAAVAAVSTRVWPLAAVAAVSIRVWPNEVTIVCSLECTCCAASARAAVLVSATAASSSFTLASLARRATNPASARWSPRKTLERVTRIPPF